MKKLYISVPITGRNNASILNTFKKMHKLAELTFGQKLEVVNPYPEYGTEENYDNDIKYLAEGIQLLSNADYFIGVYYIGGANRCNNEAFIARNYKSLETIQLNVRDCVFLKDVAERERFYRHQEDEEC